MMGSTKNTEYQVVVIKNKNREVKLAVLAIINGKGETKFNGIKTVMNINYGLQLQENLQDNHF